MCNKYKCLVVVLFLVIAGSVFVVIINDNKKEVLSKPIKEEKTTTTENQVEPIINDIVETDVKEEIKKDELKEVEQKTTKQETEQNNTNNNNTSIQEVVPSTSNKEEVIVETSTCTPKKFTWSWVVPEFDSESSCIAKGNTFTPEYGFQCDDYQDDCGDYYYMLKLYDDDSILIDWHSIEN